MSDDAAVRMLLDGEWRFSPDGQAWSVIQVPGCWEAQGYPASLEGPVVYERELNVPRAWRGRFARLRFGASSFLTRVWLNNQHVGRHDGAWDAFTLDVTAALRPGKNLLRVEVTKAGKRFPWQEALMGFIPEVAMAFGGLWQSVELEVHGSLMLSRPYARASLSGSGSASVEVHHRGSEAIPALLQGEALDPDGGVSAEIAEQVLLRPGHSTLRMPFRLSSPTVWDVDHPRLYTLRLRLLVGNKTAAQTERRFGVRELRATRRELLLNGRPFMPRGVLHWGFYPETIAPTPNDDQIREELRQIRSLGFNMVKHCLWVPPERYQDVADEMGVLLWQELPLWPPTVSPAQRHRALRQVPEIVRQRRGHPSVVMYTIGSGLNSSADSDFRRSLYRAVRRLEPQALVRDNSGSGECYDGLSDGYADFYDYHFYAEPEHLGPLMDAFAAGWRRPRPWLFGEFCDSDTFRHVRGSTSHVERPHGPESQASTAPRAETSSQLGAPAGLPPVPWWLSSDPDRNPLAAARDLPILAQERRLARAGLAWDLEELQRRSYARSLIVRKRVLERARLYPALSGYVISSLRDVPIVASGVFDDAWQPKWTPGQFEPFNADTVLMLVGPLQRRWIGGGDRLRKRETFCCWAEEQVTRTIVVSHYGRGAMRDGLRWTLEDGSGVAVASGGPTAVNVSAGTVREIGTVGFLAPSVAAPARLTLRVCLGDSRNSWPFWVFPRPAPSMPHAAIPSAVIVSHRLTDELLGRVRGGWRAVVAQSGEGRVPTQHVPFWREGLPLLYEQPILADVPHDGYADEAWEALATDYAIDQAQLQAALRPITDYEPVVRRLDCREFTVTDYLGVVRLGTGILVVTTLAFNRAFTPEWGREQCPFAAWFWEAVLAWTGKA